MGWWLSHVVTMHLSTQLLPVASAAFLCAGSEWDAMTPVEQGHAASTLAVLSRVEPMHKLRMVETLRKQVCVLPCNL